MADKKISELTAITGAATAADDVLPIVDTSATETKKITRAELAIALGVPSLPTLTNGQLWQFQSGALAATLALKDSSNNNSVDYSARILRGTNGTSSKIDWSGAVPLAPLGLIVGVDTLGPETLKVANNAGQVLADFCQAQDDTTAMLTYSCFSGGTKNTVFEQNFYGLGNSSGRGSYNNFAGTDYDLAYSWDGSDYLTYLRNHRLVLGGNNGGYINKAFLDAIAGKIVQVAEGDSGLNPYIRSVVLNSGTSTLQIYDRVVDENSTEFQNIHYLKGAGNGVSGSYTVPFQGWLNQQKQLTNDTDTGWGFQFREESFARFQINGDATYQMQVRNSAGDLIGGIRGLRPVVNSANVTPQTLTPTGNYIEYVDETGGSHFVPTYA